MSIRQTSNVTIRTLSFAVTTVLLSCSILAACTSQETVLRITDGDTIVLSNEERVRLIGIDAPETNRGHLRRRDSTRSQADLDAIREIGLLAKNHLASLVLDKPVELEFDSIAGLNGNKDSSGRTLAYVWVLDDSGNRTENVNERMLSDGFAYFYAKYPFDHLDRFRDLQREAIEASRGLWSRTDEMNSSTETDRTVRYRVAVQSTLDEAYDAITTKSGLAAWLSTEAEIDARAGGRIKLIWEDYGPSMYTGDLAGPVLAADGPDRFVFRWPVDSRAYYTTVQFDLEERYEYVLVHVTERGFQDDENGMRDMMNRASGWGAAMTRLKYFLQEGVRH